MTTVSKWPTKIVLHRLFSLYSHQFLCIHQFKNKVGLLHSIWILQSKALEGWNGLLSVWHLPTSWSSCALCSPISIVLITGVSRVASFVSHTPHARYTSYKCQVLGQLFQHQRLSTPSRLPHLLWLGDLWLFDGSTAHSSELPTNFSLCLWWQGPRKTHPCTCACLIKYLSTPWPSFWFVANATSI